jgi:CMP-N-acetylneuraminic acid synthetase
MKILGVIPARGGSKRLPRKNIADLGGKPLIAWTIEAARISKVFDRLVVSTEDEEIAGAAIRYGADWHHREPQLAKDTTPTLPVIVDVFEKNPADIIVTLQCTSPFRTAEDIRNAIDMFIKNNADSLISVCEAPNDLAYEVGFANRLRNVPNIVVPNGAIYAITGDALSKGESWFTVPVTYGFVMPKTRSLDIDNGQDLEIARMIVAKNGQN